MQVLFATAEMEPVVATGGLGAASGGLVDALRRLGVEMTPVLAGYQPWPLIDERVVELDVPSWVGGATARIGRHVAAGEVVVIDSPSLSRPHPYVDPDTGVGWRDNDHRFFAWSTAVAALAGVMSPDVVHVNDWHASMVLAALPSTTPTVLSIHNLAHQGWCDPGWIDTLGPRAERYRWMNSVNALAGAITLADRIVTVSPRYAWEITTEEGGAGLHRLLASRSDDLVGILNGIDSTDWDPSTDPHLAQRFGPDDLSGKSADHEALCAELGVTSEPGPLIVSVSRLDHQKGLDLVAQVGSILAEVPVRLAMLGSGDRETEAALSALARAHPGRVAFHQGYDAALAHRLFAAGDFALIPSRFEPCGLTQMQAMRYGTVPIVSDVGGLHDTVIDVDRSPRTGTGIVLRSVSPSGVVDGVHRAHRLWSNKARMRRIRDRVMALDWSWDQPAQRYLELYSELESTQDLPPKSARANRRST